MVEGLIQLFFAGVAQLAEQPSCKRQITGTLREVFAYDACHQPRDYGVTVAFESSKL
jgi:hypothetical protein